MREKKPFHTTTSAEFRELVEAARTTGRLNDLIQAIAERLAWYRAELQAHQATRNFQQIQETKKIITHLETKLQIARQAQEDDLPPPPHAA
jgi:hypothetical protein